ncbi:MAG: hypothetical protein R3C28_09650 [Pirellulaceae bacterium]
MSITLQAQPITDLFQQNVRTSEPIPATEQAKRFQLPTGWSIQLVASRPQIQKPLNMAFDADRRLWVTTSLNIPMPPQLSKGETGSILADTNQDGSFDSVTTFADGLNSDGIVSLQKRRDRLFDSTNYYLEDSDHDGTADQRRLV